MHVPFAVCPVGHGPKTSTIFLRVLSACIPFEGFWQKRREKSEIAMTLRFLPKPSFLLCTQREKFHRMKWGKYSLSVICSPVDCVHLVANA